MTKVMKVVEDLKIQVDNLCQVSPGTPPSGATSHDQMCLQLRGACTATLRASGRCMNRLTKTGSRVK